MDSKPITLKLAIDSSTNRVLFVESDNYFVDVLLSFLTLPIGSILHLLGNDSFLGCIGKLYESLERLDEKHFVTKACKQMLLRPANAYWGTLESLLVNVEREEPMTYYYCEKEDTCLCRLTSFYPGVICSGGHALNKPEPTSRPNDLRGFLKDINFVIRDDLVFMPSKDGDVLLQAMNIKPDTVIEERSLNAGRQEVLDLLKYTLISMTPLSHGFLHFQSSPSPFYVIPNSIEAIQLKDEALTTPSKDSQKIVAKLVVRNAKVLYAEVNHDFIDLLLSFLTFPIGCVERQLCAQSSITCIDNLYASMQKLSPNDFICDKSQEMLLSPKLDSHLSCKSQKLNVVEEATDTYTYDLPKGKIITYSEADPTSAEGTSGTSGFFCSSKHIKFMVTDELEISPFSLLSAINLHLNKDSVTTIEVEVGEVEALSLLKASLVSKSALTVAFGRKLSKIQAVTRVPKRERDN